MQKIGKQIKYYRKLKGLSQKQLAKQLNVTWETVSRWENGRVSALHKLTQIAEILSIPVSYLLNIQDPKQDYATNKGGGIPYVGQLPKTIDSLNKSYKQSLFALQLEKFIPENSFAVKVSQNLINKTSVPMDTNTILILNYNVQLQTKYTLFYDPKKEVFILKESKLTSQNKDTVARIIAIILQ